MALMKEPILAETILIFTVPININVAMSKSRWCSVITPLVICAFEQMWFHSTSFNFHTD